MQQIMIEVKNSGKAKLLLELLTSLDFVESVSFRPKTDDDEGTEDSDESPDFFDLAGLWEDRDIDQDSIRQQAWPVDRR